MARLIEKEGWKANYPKPDDVVQSWRPAPKHAVETDAAILKSVSKQRWKGLALKDFGDNKGLGKEKFSLWVCLCVCVCGGEVKLYVDM